jgi:hypothetical protein
LLIRNAPRGATARRSIIIAGRVRSLEIIRSGAFESALDDPKPITSTGPEAARRMRLRQDLLRHGRGAGTGGLARFEARPFDDGPPLAALRAAVEALNAYGGDEDTGV